MLIALGCIPEILKAKLSDGYHIANLTDDLSIFHCILMSWQSCFDIYLPLTSLEMKDPIVWVRITF